MQFLHRVFPLIFLIFPLVGCNKAESPLDPTTEEEVQLSEKTRALQAADLVGYDETKLRQSIDGMEKAQDKRHAELEKMLEGQ